MFGEKKHKPGLHEALGEAEVINAMLRDGWKPWTPNASGDEKKQAVETYISIGEATWYPPGYMPEPEPRGEEMEGKLIVEPEVIEQRVSFWQKIFG